MSDSTHDTAPTQFIDADGIRFAYRRFGAPSGIPLVLVQHFRGNMDNHDPAITDRLASGREVILFDNTGVGQSTGTAPDTIEGMAADVASFVDALGLTLVDILGHSMGGHVTQQLLLDRPDLIRRAALVGTGPRGGEGMAARPPEVAALWTRRYDPPDEMWLPILFYRSPTSQAAGRRWLERIRARSRDRDAPVSVETATSHRAAASKWGAAPADGYHYLRRIQQRILVANGLDDIIVPTINSYLLQQHLPNAQLIVYPDSAHGSHFQFPELFATHLAMFLDADWSDDTRSAPRGTEPLTRSPIRT
ncbi:MAG TPA: alpha/beta hydrolase [Solirubrobacteraceae bacterium]|jgi:pimeloyl-ACP methyl ester carboxylesterase|nr:alpha/beta hydrolase [Solirubrobacteraceae bacterium]